MYIFCIPVFYAENFKILSTIFRQKLGPPNVIMCQQFKIFVTEYHVYFNTLEVTKIYP